MLVKQKDANKTVKEMMRIADNNPTVKVFQKIQKEKKRKILSKKP